MCYNILNQVHHSFKHTLLNACVIIENNANTTNENYERSINKVSEVIKIFKDQMQQEDNLVLPLVFEYEPSIWDVYAGQHKNLQKSCTHLDSLINTFKNENDEPTKRVLLDSILEVFNEFVLMNYYHMGDEEKILNNLLAKYYSDDFLKQIDHKIKTQALLIMQENTSKYSTATAV